MSSVVERKDLESNAPHFIGSWNMQDASICDELIQFFEAHPELQTQGKTAGGLNLESKKSTDLTIRPREIHLDDHEPVRHYLQTLFACHQDYLEQWPFLKNVLPSPELSSFNIQRYEAGGHFLKVHSERTTLATSHRVLAWMTYLNDVEDGGNTHFVHQQLDIQPRKGLTLIWPAEWTHAHQAQILNSGSKYIITGWMHFPANAAATNA